MVEAHGRREKEKNKKKTKERSGKKKNQERKKVTSFFRLKYCTRNPAYQIAYQTELRAPKASRRQFHRFLRTCEPDMAARGRVLSVIARTGLQRLLTERGGGGASVVAATTFRVPPTTFSFKPASSPWSSSSRFLSAPLPAAAEQDEEQQEKSKPATAAPAAQAKPSAAAAAAASSAPIGRAPTAATAVFALLAEDDARRTRPAACDRVDLATKLLDADHAMSTPTYTREYLVR